MQSVKLARRQGAIKSVYLGADKVKKAKGLTLKAEFDSLIMKNFKFLDEFCMN